MCECARACMCVCARACMCVCARACMCVCVCARACMCLRGGEEDARHNDDGNNNNDNNNGDDDIIIFLFQGWSAELHDSPGDTGLPTERDPLRPLAGRPHRAGRTQAPPHLQPVRLPPVLGI